MLISRKFLNGSTLKNVSFVILLLKMCLLFGQKRVIVIDPGHGGKDSGAIGINYLQEKDVALNISEEILQLNKTILNDEFDIYLTRYKDTLISLSDRTRLAKSLNTDVFVSLHCNHTDNSNVKGIEVYVNDSKKPKIKESIALGLSMLKEGTRKLGFEKRGVKFADFQVLRETIAYFPSVLMEIGFISNPDEANYFLKPKNSKAMAMATLMGIINYLNTRL